MLISLLKKYKDIIIYGLISVSVMIIDALVTYVLKQIIPLVVANSIGVVTGGIIQYVLNAKFVFHVKNNNKNFGIYIFTFIIGLVIANALIYYSNNILTNYINNEKIVFIFAKGISIVVPFFALYFLRKELYKKFNKEEE